MTGISDKENWSLIRFIIPAFPEVNIFTRYARKMTSLGPIMVATCASRVWGWRVEVIDENNYTGPRDKNGLPDHAALQRENPARVVGFYCGLTSCIDRVFELAKLYRQMDVLTIAGGWHVHYCPEEALDNSIIIVVHGDGELAIQQILGAINSESSFSAIPGISFKRNGNTISNLPAMIEIPDLQNLPYPDFGLLRYARKIKCYPIGRIRGCGMACEFCSVNGKPRWSCAQYLFETVSWLVQTRNARRFFIVDDRLEQDLPGTMEFFSLIAKKYGNRLRFTVQIRLETAKNIELLETMEKAGVKNVCVGYESPIDEDLRAMRKGYASLRMAEWTKVLRRYFWVHGMFIFGYPEKEKTSGLSAQGMEKRFKHFIRRTKLDSIQILRPVPLVGTGLRKRLEAENRILPRNLVLWSMYDGNYVCFMPKNMTLRELQEIPLKIMHWFYSPLSFFRIPIKTIIFPFDYLVRSWSAWHRDWMRDIIRYGGHLLIQRLKAKKASTEFLKKIEKLQS